jgi:trehalose-6-phosphatase
VIKVNEKLDKGEIQSGDEVEFELMTDCYINKITNIATHETKAKVIFEKEQKQKLFLIDIDGTICDDIRNEESELYPTANVFPRALEIINKWYDEGNVITFFTARESKDREVTLQWLDKHGFKYHGLVMDKPRINDEQEYVWIDNKKVRAVTYLGNWTELKEVDAKIQIFG